MNKVTETIAGSNYHANSGISLGSISGCTLYIKEDLKIKDVIFNPPATIVFWNDGTKTVAKAHPDDRYSMSWGLMFCMAKKLLGSGHQVKKMLDKYAPDWDDEISIDKKSDKANKKVCNQPIKTTKLPKWTANGGAKKTLDRYFTMKPKEGVATPKCNLANDIIDENLTIFHDKETIKDLIKMLQESSYTELMQMYHNLNLWKLPMRLAEVINFPTYLYAMFHTFEIPVKEKTITPLMQFVCCEIARREHEVWVSEETCEASELDVNPTWENRYEN